MDIIDIAIAKSKSTVDPSAISSAVSNYFDEHGVQVDTDTALSVSGMPADSKAVGDRLTAVEGYALTQEQIEALSGLIEGGGKS